MEPDTFPPFSETSWGRRYVALQLSGIIATEEQRREMLRIYMSLYNWARQQWESDQRVRDNDGDILVA